MLHKSLLALISGVAFCVVNQVAFANDMPVAGSFYKAPATTIYNWAGFYAGINAGYGWSSQSIGLSGDPTFIQGAYLPASGINSVAGSAKGAIGGVQLGYNWQTGSVVYGIEADLDAADITSSQDVHFAFGGNAFTVHGEQKLDWLGTFRGRLGYAPIDRLLVYATGGLAVGHASVTANMTGDAGCIALLCAIGSSSKTKTGWAAGAGFEYALMRQWSVKAEYLYYDLGTIGSTGAEPRTAPPSYLNGSLRVNGSVGRLGLNYRFD